MYIGSAPTVVPRVLTVIPCDSLKLRALHVVGISIMIVFEIVMKRLSSVEIIFETVVDHIELVQK